MRRNIFVSIGVVTGAFLIILVSCRKINLATDVGRDLIPEVDNIHTFDTTVEVQTFNHIFTAANDTFNSLPGDEQFLGLIANDPIFGKTDARLFFQLLPTAGKNTFVGNIGSRSIDSVVLSLPFFETYGDSVLAQNLEVSEISTATEFKPVPFTVNALTNSIVYKRDSAYSIRNNNFQTSGILGTANVIPQNLKDTIQIIRRDTTKVANRIRIRLAPNFGQRLLGYDTVGVNDGYSTDSVFKTKFNGFAVKSNSGNAALGVIVQNAQLIVYYKYTDQSALKDTTATFAFKTTSAYANYVGRDYSGTQIAATSGDNVADQIAYLQNTPGTYTLLKIPALANMSNRIIHLAELKAESIYDASDALFYPPRLFIDAINSKGKNYNLPFVFNEHTSVEGSVGNISLNGLVVFGFDSVLKKDPSNRSIAQWRFNLTRYVQSVVNGRKASTDLRIHAKPFFNIADTLEFRNSDNNVIQTPITIPVTINQSKMISIQTTAVSPLVGRVRLGGGSHPTQKMKLRIVYSKL